MARPRSTEPMVRVSLYLPAEVRATLADVAASTGVSQSKVVASIIEGLPADVWATLVNTAHGQGATTGQLVRAILQSEG